MKVRFLSVLLLSALFITGVATIFAGWNNDVTALQRIFLQLPIKHYELSGICQNPKGEVFVCSDEGKIHQFDLQSGEMTFVEDSIIGVDYEALEFYDGDLWVAVEEYHRKVESFNPSNPGLVKHSKNLNGAIFEFMPETDNATIEALAIDSVNGKLYFAREYGPRQVFCYSLYNLQLPDWDKNQVRILDIYRDNHDAPLDVTDMKVYQNEKGESVLYLLERYKRQIREYNLHTHQTHIHSYHEYVCDSKGSLFSEKNCDCDSCYGSGEALMVTEDEFWIGFDAIDDTLNMAFCRRNNLNLKKDYPVLLRLPRN